MIRFFRRAFKAHKYKLAVFLLLTAASVVCVLLVAARMAYSDSSRYTNLVWNLFLAWIPFGLAYLAYMLAGRRWLMYFVVPLFSILWLLFFPNAPYILTDLQHLSQAPRGAPLWYDVILLIWFSWTGMLLGLVALNLMQEIIRRSIGRGASWIFALGVLTLSSVGLYLGRFIRINSWDILQNPGDTASSIYDWLSDPSLRSVSFILLYTLFFVFIYMTMHAFGRVLQEGSGTH